ncbi:hypothetical protein HCJ66_15605 [Listeria sp. FSL L7-1582]|uniref:hypothetical protein n=1 Tax=Listeria portnoyi TaxID=2713504 RepID=UPI00164D9C3D|nr:hypothetical protein [Listeria portnoyi]MBC6310962.1 hypothetical protein [Listeria portnoyi]
MIEQKDVITMRVPFPDISSDLAIQAHMYLCIEKGANKSFLSCQTKKPLLMVESMPPFKYVEEAPDLSRNPFKYGTLIACDFSFCFKGIKVDKKMLTNRRRDVCEELFQDVVHKINHPDFSEVPVDEVQLLKLNHRLKKMSII